MRKYFTIVLLTLVALVACKEKAAQAIKTEEIAFTKEGEVEIFKADSLLVKLDVEVASTDYETQTGLMYRSSMAEKNGMLFIFDDVRMHSFYMKNTQIPLDIIFIDENWRIASFQENAEPMNENGLSSQVPVQYVLEVNAGLAEKWLLEVGDSIAFKKTN